jgi:hypothetical protein
MRSVALLLFAAVCIAQQSIQVMSPQSTDVIYGGFLTNITWTSSGLQPSDEIGIQVWDATAWLSIGSFGIGTAMNSLANYTTPNTGVYGIYAPIVSGNASYYVVVYLLANANVNGQSQSFSITCKCDCCEKTSTLRAR